jgi:2-polyprenyl-3-methyl-5-hydroxy-6-metoxy-1,4-benzoquinol methylase
LKYQKYSLTFCECIHCKTVYTNPRPTEKILSDYYKKSKSYKYWNEVIFPASEKKRRKNIFKPRVDKILSLCKKHSVHTGKLVEVGAGFGTFLSEMATRKAFSSLIAIEPTPSLAETCRKKGIKTIESTIEEVPPNTIKADVAVCFEVIEHLFSPTSFLISCNKILKQGGMMVIACPNIFGFDIQTLGTISDTIDVEHLNYFNPNSLSYLLESTGFAVVEKQTPGVLDADLVRSKVLSGKFSLRDSFLKTVLFEKWEKVGSSFQEFLQRNLLSSNMWIVAIKR